MLAVEWKSQTVTRATVFSWLLPVPIDDLDHSFVTAIVNRLDIAIDGPD